eukprot:COSAG04_NODE_17337_length_472_cov_0.828418_2_plen_66_part_01
MEGSVGWRSMKSIVSSATDTPPSCGWPEAGVHGQTFPPVHLHSCEPKQTAAKGCDPGDGVSCSAGR